MEAEIESEANKVRELSLKKGETDIAHQAMIYLDEEGEAGPLKTPLENEQLECKALLVAEKVEQHLKNSSIPKADDIGKEIIWKLEQVKKAESDLKHQAN